MTVGLAAQSVNLTATPSVGNTAIIAITPTVAHSLLVLTIHMQTSVAGVTSVTSAPGGTWTKAVELLTSGSYTAIYYLPDCPAGIASVSAVLSAATSYDANVSQWSGMALASVLTDTGSGARTTSPNTSALVDATAGDLVIGAISSNSAVARNIVAPATQLNTGVLPASFTGSGGYYIPPAPGSYEITWTTSSGANTGGVAATFAQAPDTPFVMLEGELSASSAIDASPVVLSGFEAGPTMISGQLG